jgi:hypothetical protein
MGKAKSDNCEKAGTCLPSLVGLDWSRWVPAWVLAWALECRCDDYLTTRTC